MYVSAPCVWFGVSTDSPDGKPAFIPDEGPHPADSQRIGFQGRDFTELSLKQSPGKSWGLGTRLFDADTSTAFDWEEEVASRVHDDILGFDVCH